MQLIPEQIRKYQHLYKKRFGLEISEEEAYEQGLKLVRLVEFIFKPPNEENPDKLLNEKLWKT